MKLLHTENHGNGGLIGGYQASSCLLTGQVDEIMLYISALVCREHCLDSKLSSLVMREHSVTL